MEVLEERLEDLAARRAGGALAARQPPAPGDRIPTAAQLWVQTADLLSDGTELVRDPTRLVSLVHDRTPEHPRSRSRVLP